MPDRVFRDEILSSPRYWRLSSDTPRMLFFHLGLCADDLGIFRAANYTIRQTCFGADNKPAPEALAKMLVELVDADLVRLYQFEGAEYGFIPRWRQRLRIIKPRFPLPPPQLRDNAINEVIQKMSVGWPTAGGHLSAESKGIEGNRKESNTKKGLADESAEAKPGVHWWRNIETIVAKGKEYGIEAQRGEDRDGLYKRVQAAIKAGQR